MSKKVLLITSLFALVAAGFLSDKGNQSVVNADGDMSGALYNEIASEFSSLRTTASIAAEYEKVYPQAMKLESVSEETFDENDIYYLGKQLGDVVMIFDSKNGENVSDKTSFSINSDVVNKNYLYDVAGTLIRFVKKENSNYYYIYCSNNTDLPNKKNGLCLSVDENDKVTCYFDEIEAYYSVFDVSFIDNKIKIDWIVNQEDPTEKKLTLVANSGYGDIYDFVDVSSLSYPDAYDLYTLYKYRPTRDYETYYEEVFSGSDLLDCDEFSFIASRTIDDDPLSEKKEYFSLGDSNEDNSFDVATCSIEDDTAADKKLFTSGDFATFSLEKVTNKTGKYYIKHNTESDDKYLKAVSYITDELKLVEKTSEKSGATEFEIVVNDGVVYLKNSENNEYVSFIDSTRSPLEFDGVMLSTSMFSNYQARLFKKVVRSNIDDYYSKICNSQDGNSLEYRDHLKYRIKFDLPYDLYQKMIALSNLEFSLSLEYVDKNGQTQTKKLTLPSEVKENESITYVFSFMVDYDEKDYEINTRFVYDPVTYQSVYSEQRNDSVSSLAKEYLTNYLTDPAVKANEMFLRQLAGN